MSERTNRMAWKRLDLPDPFAPTVEVGEDGRWSRGERGDRGWARGGVDAWIWRLFLNGGCAHSGEKKQRHPSGRLRGAHGGSGKRNARGVRTDTVQVRLKVHRCLLAVGLEPFQHHLFDVHIAVARKSSRCQDL